MTDQQMECAACRRLIDAEARLCPYCGADPRTGERFDATQLLEETFPRRRDLPAREKLLDVFRRRQSLAIAAILLLLMGVAFGLHQWAEMRNQTAVNDVPAVPLTDIADLSNKTRSETPIPLPDLEFAYDGNPRTMRTLLVEPGATPPAAAQAPAGTAPPAAAGVSPPVAAPPPAAQPAVPATPPLSNAGREGAKHPL